MTKILVSVSAAPADAVDNLIAGLRKLGIVSSNLSGSRGGYFIDAYKAGKRLESKGVKAIIEVHTDTDRRPARRTVEYTINGVKGTVRTITDKTLDKLAKLLQLPAEAVPIARSVRSNKTPAPKPVSSMRPANVKFTHGVYLQGGAIGETAGRKNPIQKFTSKEDATAYARRRNAQLTPGEKSYYKMKYVAIPLNKK